MKLHKYTPQEGLSPEIWQEKAEFWLKCILDISNKNNKNILELKKLKKENHILLKNLAKAEKKIKNQQQHFRSMRVTAHILKQKNSFLEKSNVQAS